MKRANTYQSGMHGVFQTAAELTRLGFIVSPTLRNAAGADLLVTDPWCRKAWTVQVKTNGTPNNYWLLNKDADRFASNSHVYVFVNLKGEQRPEFIVVPSEHVAKHLDRDVAKTGSIWYSFCRSNRFTDTEGWKEVFGEPGAVSEADGASAGA